MFHFWHKTIYRPRLTILVALLCMMLSLTARAEWMEIRDDELHVYFQPRNEDQARHILAMYRQYMPVMETQFDHSPAEVHVLVIDNTDLSNGYSTPIPVNINGIFLIPPTDGQLLDQDTWLDTLIRHEIFHLYHIDSVEKYPKDLQSVFGRNLLLFPALYLPLWAVEGAAVFEETDQKRGYGRGAAGYFDAIMRLEFFRGYRSVNNVTYNSYGYPRGVSYYYGYYFFEFIHSRYGEDTMVRFLRDYNGNLVPFMLSSTLEGIYGKDLHSLWDEYRSYLRKKFGAQIGQINKSGISEGTQYTVPSQAYPRGQFAQDGSIYYVYEDPYTGIQQIRRRLPRQLVQLPQQGEPIAQIKQKLDRLMQTDKKVATAKTIGSFDLHPQGGLIYSALESCDQPDGWNTAIYYGLYLLQPGETNPQKLFSCSRYKQVHWHPDGGRVVAIRHTGGLAQLDLLTLNGETHTRLYSGTQDEVLGDFDLDDDGNMVISRYVSGKGWDLYLSAITRNIQFRQLTQSGNIVTSPAFGSNGQIVLYSSNQGGVYNIRRMDLTSGKVSTVTNSISAVFHPALAPDGKTLTFSRMYRTGFALHSINADTRKQLASLTFDKPVVYQPVDIQDYVYPTAPARPYSIFTRAGPQYWLPLVDSNRDYTSLGAITGGRDVLANQQWLLSAYLTRWDRYDPRNHYGYNALYQYRRLLQLSMVQQEVVVLRDRANRSNTVMATNTTQSAIIEHALYQTTIDRLFAFAGLVGDQETRYRTKTHSTKGILDSDSQTTGIGINWTTTHKGFRAFVPTLLVARFITEQIDDLQNTQRHSKRYNAHLNQYIHIGGGNFVSYIVMRGEAESTSGAFTFGSKETSTTPILPTIGSSKFPLLGYERGNPDLMARAFTYTEVAWNIPGFEEGVGFISPPLGLGKRHFRLVFQQAHLQNPIHAKYRHRRFSSLAFESRIHIVLGYSITLPFKFTIARGLDKGGVDQWALTTDYSF